MGVYGMRQSPFDVFLLYVVGLAGFLMRGSASRRRR